MGFQESDKVLALIGIIAAVWCVGLTLLVVRSDLRQKHLSLDALAVSFAVLVASLGESLRKSRS